MNDSFPVRPDQGPDSPAPELTRSAGEPLDLTIEHYESILRTTGSAVICISPEHRILIWNHGAEKVFGFSSAEVVGKDYFGLFLPEECWDAVATEVRRILTGEVTRNFENPVRVRDGGRKVLLWNASRLLGRDGRPLGVAAIGQDVTALKRAQTLQSGESRALELLARRASLEEVLESLARMTEDVCPGVHCAVMLAGADERSLRCAAAPTVCESFRRAMDGAGMGGGGGSAAAAARSKRRVVSVDIGLDPVWGPLRETALRHGFRACWSQPVFSTARGGVVLGTFDCYCGEAREPSEFELETAVRAARLAGIAIEHQRAEEERLRESERRLQSAVVELETLREELQKKFSLDEMVAVSPAMLRVIHLASQVAPTEATVLITGETGTGKEVLARAIHANSPRRNGPFIAVNCGAIPEPLMESELFGHEKGAFTGADKRKPGQVERARGGTLFLDEVGELVPSAQVKLLRVLQEKAFSRLGGTETLSADVRVVAATNRDLAAEMEKGQFREDLFYRLNVFHIHIPPLRDRREAIPLLANRLLQRIAAQLGRPEIGLSKAAMDVLAEYHWKGNVRELQNALERAAILCDGSLIAPEHLPILTPPADAGQRLTDEHELVVRLDQGFSMERLEQRLVRRAVKLCRGNKSKAARLLGISRGSLRWRLERLER